MTRDTVLGLLTGANMLILAAIATSQVLPATAQGSPQMLRGSGLEIVDGEGRLRATLSIQPAVEGATETVLFRLINADGQPSAKISASMTGAGLSFVGGDDLSHIILEADGAESRLKLVEQGGKERLIEP